MMARAVTGQPDRVVVRPRLDAAERRAVAALKRACDAHDGLDQPLHLEDADCPAVLHYRDGRLTGVATLQLDSPVEACGLVDPPSRRRGIGRLLLESVETECRRLGRGLLLTLAESSPSGRAFALAVGGRYSHAEYALELGDPPPEREWPVRLEIRPIGLDEAATFTRVGEAAYGRGESAERLAEDEAGLRAGAHSYYLVWLDGAPIATARLSLGDGPAYVTSLGVLPEHQGRGYGRQILTRLVQRLAVEGRRPIRIEVATDNPGALHLYRSCGFQVQRAYSYFEVDR
jgi:ribosomal protein S18 acetylase RimI-like enzyme